MRIAEILLGAIVAPLLFASAAVAAPAAPSPCSLLSAGDVAAMLGPLAAPPFRSDGYAPVADGDRCRYVGTDLRSLLVSVNWKTGQEDMSALAHAQGIVGNASGGKTLMGPNGVSVTGEWDEARLVGDGELDALRGEQLVTIDYTASKATVADVAKLADKAILNLDAPLAVDDAAGLAAAAKLIAGLPKQRPVCDLVTADDITIATGKAPPEPSSGDDASCTFSWLAPAASKTR